jgi:hypothetical protein
MNLGTRTITLVLTAPPYLFGAIVSFAVAYSSDRRNERGYHISAPMAVAIVGFAISAATLNNAARYTASFLYCAGAFAANATVYSWAAGSLNQTPEKRACARARLRLSISCRSLATSGARTFSRLTMGRGMLWLCCL